MARLSNERLKLTPQLYSVEVEFNFIQGDEISGWRVDNTIVKRWYAWLDENLTGYYCAMVAEPKESPDQNNLKTDKLFCFSFSEERDAVLFKMYFR